MNEEDRPSCRECGGARTVEVGNDDEMGGSHPEDCPACGPVCAGDPFPVADPPAAPSEPHVWTHPAEDCDVIGCTHRQVRTCEQSEKEKQFLRRIIDGLRDRLYKADPNAARTDWNRLMRALDWPEMIDKTEEP